MLALFSRSSSYLSCTTASCQVHSYSFINQQNPLSSYFSLAHNLKVTPCSLSGFLFFFFGFQAKQKVTAKTKPPRLILPAHTLQLLNSG